MPFVFDEGSHMHIRIDPTQLKVSSISYPFMLNLDMIGRNPERSVGIVGEAYSSGLREIVERANDPLQLDIAFGGTNYQGNRI